MDYIGNKCPVCNKYFHADDDIVVCPECGTPHHRECYEQIGHCANSELHSQGYDYAESNDNETNGTKICPKCGKHNEADCFFCKNCGTPLTDTDPKHEQQPQQNSSEGIPFGGAPGGIPFDTAFLDPLGGVPGDTDLGDGVTAGEAAKYVKQNTPYFIRIFSNIKNFNKSKFNFSAALFTGGYLLYRKMYKIGSIIVALQAAMMILEIYLELAYSSLFAAFSEVYANATDMSQLMSGYTQFMSTASSTDIMVLYLPSVMEIIRIALMISIGLCFNRMYMNHCKKQIISIKSNTTDGENPETVLQTKGGVNTALAVSLLISAMIIMYLPRFIVGLL